MDLQPCPAIACAFSASYAVSGPTGDPSICSSCYPAITAMHSCTACTWRRQPVSAVLPLL